MFMKRLVLCTISLLGLTYVARAPRHGAPRGRWSQRQTQARDEASNSGDHRETTPPHLPAGALQSWDSGPPNMRPTGMNWMSRPVESGTGSTSDRPSPSGDEIQGQNRYPRDAIGVPWTLVEPSTLHGFASMRPRWQINRFMTADGKVYGPLYVGRRVFQGTHYPLDIPLFRDLYTNDGLTPANFEDFVIDNKIFGLHRLDPRPEPQILFAIEELITRSFAYSSTIRFRARNDLPLLEGEFAWPPVRVRTNQVALDMPISVLSHLKRVIWLRLGSHQAPTPTMYHVWVPTPQGYRHILMTKVPAEDHTDVHGAERWRSFWLMLEGMVPQEGRPKMVLLGGMFLPNDIVSILRRSGHLQIAFPSLVGPGR